MGNKSTKYDDVILMQYADGELDDSTRLRLEKDLANNKELQGRLAIFALTRDDLISTKSKLPKHIEDLIDEQDRISGDEKITRFASSIQHPSSTTNVAIEQDNMVIGFFKNYPIQSLVASVMFGLLIGSQGMKGLYTSPYSDTLINRPISEYRSVSKDMESLDQAQPIIRELPPRIKDGSNNTAIRLLKALNRNKDIKNISTSKDGQSIKIISEFKNTNNQKCKLTEIDRTYLVACKNKSGNWSIYQTK
jgi:hypothetical protein